MQYDVVGIDSPCIDLAVNVEQFPEVNHGQIVKNCSWQGGGKVATGLIAAARLGARAAVIGNIGDDVYGAFIRKDFIRHGIDTKQLLSREGKTTHFSTVISDKKTKGRSILFYPGSAEPINADELPLKYLCNTKYFYIARLDEVTVKAATIARESGADIIIDADSYLDNLEDHLPLIDIFIGSEFLYRSMFPDEDYEKNCRTVMEKGPEVVVFTFGEKGCVGFSKEGYFTVPAYQVEVVDTVGAGDVYHGAFVAGLLYHWPIPRIAQFASAVSAIKCTRIGGRAGIPDRKTAERFMESGIIDYMEIDQRVKFYQRGMEHV
ncbi:MAG: carbohydrate kinase, PfkB family [Herbinix sp.]|nr:carbohydrate kinase, PfkB family [Herbinix sp.]